MSQLNSDATPESLMENFKGPKFVSLVILTVVVHVVIIFGSSVPYVIGKFADSSKMTKDEKIKLAVEEATIELREIAEKYQLNPQEISDQFSGGGSRTKAADDAAASADQGEDATAKPDETPEEPEGPKSAIEKAIETKVEGPKMPTFEDKKDDIF